MQPDPLVSLWERLDTDPPLFTSDDLDRELGGLRERILQLGILQETSGSQSELCPNCPESHIGPIQSLSDARTGRVQSYIVCPECGPVPIHSECLRRWEVDIPGFLKAVWQATRGRIAPVELIAGHLWRVGNATWCGRRREAYFIRRVHTGNRESIVAALATRPKAVLFFPTDSAALRWTQTKNPVVAFESVVSLGLDNLLFDSSIVESRLAEASISATATSQKRRHPKRAIRTERIDRLTKEMIRHLVAARDHAFATLELSKVAKLLRRPSKKQLGERVGLSKPAVTICFKDEAATALRVYWDAACDLEQVLKFRTPAGGEPKT